MADQLYLSCWIRDFTEHNMLRQFEQLLRVFPFSPLSQAGPLLKIYAFEYAEPPLLERSFTGSGDVAALLEAAKEFQNPDCAYLVESWWDLWQFETDWKLAPSGVSLCCHAPLFQNDLGDHLRVELGLDSHFLPQPGVPRSATMVQSNIRGLLRFVHELDSSLSLDSRRLWSESGDNFADRLLASLP